MQEHSRSSAAFGPHLRHFAARSNGLLVRDSFPARIISRIPIRLPNHLGYIVV
jgi:hypothetical protein